MSCQGAGRANCQEAGLDSVGNLPGFQWNFVEIHTILRIVVIVVNEQMPMKIVSLISPPPNQLNPAHCGLPETNEYKH